MSVGAAALRPRRRRSRRRALGMLAFDRRARRLLLLVATAAAALGSCYLLWFRDSPLVRVREVRVAGLTTADAPRLREALTAAARTMTTLHVRKDRLERAVAGYPIVRSLEVHPSFPGTLRIAVVDQHPAALAVSGASRAPVAADGSVLRGLRAGRPLPLLSVPGPLPAGRLHGARTLRLLRVLAGAPGALAARLRDVQQTGARGIVVRMRRGPDLFFGDSGRLAAKWIAAARVLADPAARGASYVDLRLPERPAAGGLPAQTVAPVAPAGEQGEEAPATAPAPGTSVATATPNTQP